MQKCSYCCNEANDSMVLHTKSGFEEDNVQFYYCCEEHKNKIEDFTDYVNKNGNKFIAVVLIDMLVMIIGLVVALIINQIYLTVAFMAIPIFVLGLLIIKYPFATPQTNEKLGIERAVKLTRKLGIALCIISLVIGIGTIFSSVIF